MTGLPRAHVVTACDGERFTFNGTERLMKLTGGDSEGHLTVYESIYSTGIPSPLRIHHNAIESFHMVEGTCRFRVGDDVVDADAGTFVFVPRGATHGLVPIGGPARALVMFAPAAMEGSWEEAAAAAEAGPLDQTETEEIARRYHLEMVGPWPTDDEGPR